MPNRLAHETSPYLQQHAGNPVDWYPWGEEALERARREDKPILLSIGYSACHWCHVMAHESFEDAEVAAVMNRDFVNIKVDREERPDIDQIYQAAQHMLTQRTGGWPLTVFLTPDATPFFGGTYFPKSSRYNLPGFVQVLQYVAGVYRDRRAEVERQNESVLAALAKMGETQHGGAHHADLDAKLIGEAIEQLKRSFDRADGGFGAAPKFPHVTDLALCMRRFASDNDMDALHVAIHTLTKMAEGGIYDQLGGGFCRYSVDASWTIPHFEKMLYDNGPLLGLYADAWAVTKNPLFKRVVEETAEWVMREMQSAEGGYYSSLDADSEGEEGKFYVWDAGEPRSLLSAEEYSVVARHYGLAGPPNFESDHWHLRVTEPLASVAQAVERPLDDCELLLASACAKLFAARSLRIRPGTDDKVLTSWNALMIAGMAHAGRVFNRQEWLGSAWRAADFIRNSLWKNGRLLATYKDGHAHLNAYLDDHAFLLDALLELLQAHFRGDALAFAEDLAKLLLDKFEDKGDAGGFYFTSHDHERLIQRPKPGHDNATPSGNGMAAVALQRLGHLTGEMRYLNAAERTLQAFYAAIEQQPAGYATLLAALAEHSAAPRIVVLRGPAHELHAWQRELASDFRPGTLLLAVPSDARDLSPTLAKPAPTSGVNAYVCEGVSCLPPASTLQALRGILDADVAIHDKASSIARP